MNARTSLSRNDHPQALRPSYLRSGSAYVPRRDSEGNLVRNRSKQRNRKRSVETIRRHQKAAWLDPSEQDRLLRQRSLSEARRGNYTAAIEGLNLLIERNPFNAMDYNNRGLVYFQNGLSAAALADYNHAIKLNPRLASAYNNRANYYAAQGRLAEAIADYENAIDLDPTNVRAWINQGITFRELEMYPQAIENFDHALQITQFLASSPSSTMVLESHIFGARGRTHHLAGDWNYAIADYHRALGRLDELNAIEITSPSRRLQLQTIHWLDQLTAPNN
jgi:tetratricopeptide (TPR) repeat protein